MLSELESTISKTSSVLILSDSPKTESGLARAAEGIKKSLQLKGYHVRDVDDFQEDTWEKKLISGIQSGTTHVITVHDIWNLESIRQIKQRSDSNFIWIGYVPIEGEQVPQYVQIGGQHPKKVDIYNILNSMDMIVPYTEFGKKELLKIRDDIQEPIFHAIDTEKFKFNPYLKKKAKEKEHRLTFGYVGTNIPRKGLDNLIYNWGKIINACNEAGYYNPTLYLRTKETGYSVPISELIKLSSDGDSIIQIGGKMDDQDLLEFYHLIDIYISCHNAEGFGLPIAEAICCGAFPLVNDYAGPHDLVYPLKWAGCLPECSVIRDVNLPWVRKNAMIDMDYIEDILYCEYHNFILNEENRIKQSEEMRNKLSYETIGNQWCKIIQSSQNKSNSIKTVNL